MNLAIHWMCRSHLQSVLHIENESFSEPWTEEEFIRCLRQRNCIGMVAEEEDEIKGFMIYELHKNRLHLLDFAVAQASRREGVGSAMVDKLTSKLCFERRNRITMHVRETNLAAQVFFRAKGFRATKVDRGFYDDNEDAYLMIYRHTSDTASPCFLDTASPGP